MKNKKNTIDQLAIMMEKGFDGVDEQMSALRETVEALDVKFSQKIDTLTTTLDKFLKRMTDMEDEFAMMKHDMNRMKKIIKEKLGVEL